MEIRRATEQDTDDVLELLVQVCMVHHNARPDLLKGPATKYTREELKEIFQDDQRPVFACIGEDGHVKGYAFCIVRQLPDDNVLTDIRTLYIDDLCVHEKCRGQHIGKKLYEYVLDYARGIGCYNVTLNVWEGNDSAYAFYKKRGMKVQKTGMEVIL